MQFCILALIEAAVPSMKQLIPMLKGALLPVKKNLKPLFTKSLKTCKILSIHLMIHINSFSAYML